MLSLLRNLRAMKSDVTFLGVVKQVIGSKLHAEISPDIPSANPIINGRIYRLGQIGSFVRIPVGFHTLYGIIATVGASELLSNLNETEVPVAEGQRWIEVQLVGESYAGHQFQRGVSIFPTIDDEVHVVTEADLTDIYGSTGSSSVVIGKHVASDDLQATIDLDKTVTRHAAILGSTGSGKSNTVACLLKGLNNAAFPNAQVVVIDPHGEYASALENSASVLSIDSTDSPLAVPYWALSFDELAWLLVDRKHASESPLDIALRDQILELKKQNCGKLRAGKIEQNITADSPIPFSLNELWYYFDRAERITYEDMKRSQEALIEEGDADKLIPAKFKAPGAGSSAPFKPIGNLSMASYVHKIISRLNDKRFNFLLEPNDFDGIKKDLDDLLIDWLDHEHTITVFDLAGVPFEVIDLIVGVVTRILFEAMFWGQEMPGIGKKRPLLMVYEEAHAYLPRGGTGPFVSGYSSKAVRRVFKEGRKYGMGGVVVSQRPSELDESILSQCGTFFALRLSNSDDQARIRSIVPDSLTGLIELLPALRTGEALVLGEGVQIPSRIRLPLIEPRPKSIDPEVSKRWLETKLKENYFSKVVTGWRQQEMPTYEKQQEEEVNSSDR